MLYLTLKYLLVIGASVLLGTGAGIAFFMLAAHVRRDAALIAGTAQIVVLADFVFTASCGCSTCHRNRPCLASRLLSD